jgi:hypothetical protein
MARTQTAALLALAVLAAPACARTTTGASAPQAHADPTTASSTAEQPSKPMNVDIDALVLSAKEANNLIGSDQLQTDVNAVVEKNPTHYSQSVSPCSSVEYAPLGDESWFGTNWQNFRFARYSGYSNVSVSQGISVYKADNEAAQTFKKWSETLRACSASDSSILPEEPSSKTLRWTDTAENASQKQCSAKVELNKNVALFTETCLFEGAESANDRIASAIQKKLE